MVFPLKFGRVFKALSMSLLTKEWMFRFRHIALFPSSDRHMASARGPHGRSDCPKNPMKREPVGIVVDGGCGDVAERYAPAATQTAPPLATQTAPLGRGELTH